MSDDPTQYQDGAYGASPTAPYVQLTQVRVPLDEAADAFSTPDAAGRLPIVLLTGERSRIRNEFVLAGLVVLAIGVLFDIELQYRATFTGVAAVLIFLGIFRSLMVRVPESAVALLLQRGKFTKSIGPGTHWMLPTIVVSHLVTRREIPFDVPVASVPTKDGVRVDVDVLLTFGIDAPERFVFNIAAPDFDAVCQASSQEAIRHLVRSVDFDDVLDLAGAESDQLRKQIGSDLETYGVAIRKVVVTLVRPPASYMDSIEGRRLASVQRAEQEERHTLEQRRQADQEQLDRQRVTADRELIDLEAANESLRLQRLEERIKAYPDAARYDLDTTRLGVARALAGNSRTMLHIGEPGDLAAAIFPPEEIATPVARPKAAPAVPPKPAPAPRRRA